MTNPVVMGENKGCEFSRLTTGYPESRASIPIDCGNSRTARSADRRLSRVLRQRHPEIRRALLRAGHSPRVADLGLTHNTGKRESNIPSAATGPKNK
ncbi:hypothetical protein RRG08_059457 [Elysia crispata]|uniref:Uncharacterized protein n=1 Tax=Elysia crispata TaxID=231223 RepID=A0AAE1A4J1_9GAST|nr:hypothetical protein RRG08_059457 [Elysia crispata]